MTTPTETTSTTPTRERWEVHRTWTGSPIAALPLSDGGKEYCCWRPDEPGSGVRHWLTVYTRPHVPAPTPTVVTTSVVTTEPTEPGTVVYDRDGDRAVLARPGQAAPWDYYIGDTGSRPRRWKYLSSVWGPLTTTRTAR